ncbi:MAG: SpoIIE family protein phosphatase [Bdellovibrionales bacterium]|nr:SpoIIE family protein phosphatase [Bdellovibrionales bacterium]
MGKFNAASSHKKGSRATDSIEKYIQMIRTRYIPLKYKFVFVLLLIVFGACSAFFYSSYQTTYQDKKLFIRELNMANLDAALSAITFELRVRIDDLQSVVRRIYVNEVLNKNSGGKPYFQSLSSPLGEEVLGVSFYRLGTSGEYERIHRYMNPKKIAGIPSDVLDKIESAHPPAQMGAPKDEEISFFNRSLSADSSTDGFPVLTIVLQAIFADARIEKLMVAIDLQQDFLRRILQRSEVSEVFLVSEASGLISHSLLGSTIRYAGKTFNHPILQRISSGTGVSESLELDVNGESYLCNLASTGFKGLYIVSQTEKRKAFLALQTLIHRSLMAATIIAWFVVLLGILFAGRLTKNIRKLTEAAHEVGKGNLEIRSKIRSNDEMRVLGKTFDNMISRIVTLLEESREKGRMEHELQTAKLVQTSLLQPPQIQNHSVEVVGYYSPMSECGGDLWDGWLREDKLSLVVADATGHGAAAAIATAVAKSSIETLNAIYGNQDLDCPQTLAAFNYIMHASCKGAVVMSMSMVQLDLRTGRLTICSAGHEAPIRQPAKRGRSPRKRRPGHAPFSPEYLKVKTTGERLGFAPDSRYEPVSYQLDPGDTVLLYTDGITEAPNAGGREWGESSLRRHLSKNWDQPLAVIRDRLSEGIHAHIKEVGQNDDITFVLLRWMPKETTIEPAPPVTRTA